MMFKILLIVLSILVFNAQAGLVVEIAEKATYTALKEGLKASGKSETVAQCIIDVMKLTGATNDVTDIRNIFQPEELLSKLKEKGKFADFICSNGSPMFVLLVIAVILISLCICCSCFRSKHPAIHIISMPRNVANKPPYMQMEIV